MSNQTATPPKAERIPHTVSLHGHSRTDNYHWLRDERWQEVMRDPTVLDAKIRKYLEEENAHTEAHLTPTAALQQTLFEELKGRIREDESSLPTQDGPWDYYVRYEKGGQHPKYCRRPTRPVRPLEEKAETGFAGEQLLLDADAESRPHSYFNLGSVSHSPDHNVLAFALDSKGSEYFEVQFIDLSTGQRLSDRIENTSGAVVFAADSQTVLYTVMDENHRPSKVMRHKLGQESKHDELVYEELDSGFFVGVGGTEDDRHILISCHDHTTSEVWVIDANQPESAPRLLAPRQQGIEYECSSLGDDFLVLTNRDAEDFCLMVASVSSDSSAQWRPLVPHRPGCLIVGATTFAQFIVRLEREGGLPRIVIRNRSDNREHCIAFDEEAYSLGLSPGYEFATDTLRFTYSSLTTPRQTFDYNMATRERTLLKEQEIPSGHAVSQYQSARLQADSHDGQQVPVSLLWHKDTPLDGTAPVLLYGYGSYGHSMPAAFSGGCLNLVNRGFIYAIAHVRGGKDKGYGWYRSGKLMQKKNTFADFIAAAELLIAKGYTKAGQISIHGGSAGGMLVGAVANLRPDLLCSVVGEVPFVDVLNTMCDSQLPLTPPEWPEWGNPLESKEAYDYILSYCPYSNVQAKAYPHILATAGLTDPRVTYWEPAKWVARLRELKTDNNLLLLKTYMEAGHGGSAGRFDKLKEVALVHAFLLLAHDRVHTRPASAVGLD